MQVKCEVREHRPRRAFDLQVRFPLQRHDSVRTERIDGGICAALAQLKRSCGRVRHNGKAYPRKPWLSPPIIVVAREDNFFVLFGADKSERSRADWLTRDLIKGT